MWIHVSIHVKSSQDTSSKSQTHKARRENRNSSDGRRTNALPFKSGSPNPIFKGKPPQQSDNRAPLPPFSFSSLQVQVQVQERIPNRLRREKKGECLRGPQVRGIQTHYSHSHYSTSRLSLCCVSVSACVCSYIHLLASLFFYYSAVP